MNEHVDCVEMEDIDDTEENWKKLKTVILVNAEVCRVVKVGKKKKVSE